MIANIMLTGTHNVRVNTQGNFKVADKILNYKKDIPFVRYRFEQYGNGEIQYIKELMDKFNKSTHLVELHWDLSLSNNIAAINEGGLLDKVALYLYVDIFDDTVQLQGFSEQQIQIMNSSMQALNWQVDRVMLKDKTTTLDGFSLEKIKKQLSKAININVRNIGVCSSPLSLGDNCCLNAIKARELMAKYSQVADVALPTANHQDMNTCGCIRHFVITGDTEEVPVEVKEVTKSKESSKKNTNRNTTKPKKKTAKQSLNPSMFKL